MSNLIDCCSIRATLTDKYLPARVAAAAVLKSICGEVCKLLCRYQACFFLLRLIFIPFPFFPQSNLIPTTDFDACLVAMAKGFEVRCLVPPHWLFISTALAVYFNRNSCLFPTTRIESFLTNFCILQGSDLDTRLALAEVFALVCVSALADATWQVCLLDGKLFCGRHCLIVAVIVSPFFLRACQSVKSAKRQSRADVMSLFRGLLVRSSGTNDARVGVAEALVYFFQVRPRFILPSIGNPLSYLLISLFFLLSRPWAAHGLKSIAASWCRRLLRCWKFPRPSPLQRTRCVCAAASTLWWRMPWAGGRASRAASTR